MRTEYVSTQWVKAPAKDDTQVTQRPLNKDLTTNYQNDFKAWKLEQRKPFRAHHSLSVEDHYKNVVIVETTTKLSKTKALFEGVSTYSSDFIPHPVQPRTNKTKKVYQSLLREHCKPNGTSAAKYLEDPNDFFQRFQVWSLETELHGHPRDSTSHRGHVEPKNQSTESVLPTQTDTSKELPRTLLTREFYRAWNGPESFQSAHETSDWPIMTTFYKHDPKLAETKQTFKTTAQRRQRPAEERPLSSAQPACSGPAH